jgi:hypothetical protein
VVWQQWYEQRNNQKSLDNEGLHTIAEGGSVGPDDESVMSLDNASDHDKDLLLLELDTKASFSSLPCRLLILPLPLFGTVFAFISDIDICNAYASGLSIKSIIVADETAADRRKAYLSSIALTGKELSKMRKQEKKKKLKQANLKDTKKGHKAVKVCRR